LFAPLAGAEVEQPVPLSTIEFPAILLGECRSQRQFESQAFLAFGFVELLFAPLPPGTEKLQREAKARRVAKSVVLRESLELALRPSPGRRAASCFDLARDLAGSLKGLPRDLAHNPKYMDGFGE